DKPLCRATESIVRNAAKRRSWRECRACAASDQAAQARHSRCLWRASRPPCLAQQTTSDDRPDGFHAAFAVRDHLIVQVGGPAGVVHDHLDALPDLRLLRAGAQIDVAVLL